MFFYIIYKWDVIILDNGEKLFPDYFACFELPAGAREEKIIVYRACRTGRVEPLSFMPSFEENNLKYNEDDDPNDPSVYSLSTYEKPKDVKRFVALTSDFQVPFKIAKGTTDPSCGLVQRTKERRRCKSSHVDWWLYKNSKPCKHFKLINNFDDYLTKFNKNKGDKNESYI